MPSAPPSFPSSSSSSSPPSPMLGSAAVSCTYSLNSGREKSPCSREDTGFTAPAAVGEQEAPPSTALLLLLLLLLLPPPLVLGAALRAREATILSAAAEE